jgi:DNA-binding GntR family transcriptional regulator
MSSTLIPLRPARLPATAARRDARARAAAAGAAKRKARNANGADLAAVYEQIWTAIIDQRLPPGTRLVEERLCEIFGLGRTRLRQVLQRLAHERVVTLMPNRGAVVAKPSVREAHEVFAAREVLEAGTVAGFIRSATRADCARLHQHVTREHAAWRQGDRRAALKYSGEFHLIVAEVGGNPVLTGMLRDLVSRSSLIIAAYQVPTAPCCPPQEHRELARALERRQSRAVSLMVRHLERVRADLKLEEVPEKSIDLRSVFTNGRRAP